MYKVFLRDKVICFAAPDVVVSPGDIIFENLPLADIQKVLSDIDKDPLHTVFWFLHEASEQYFINFYTRMKIVAAAGGAVINEKKEMLFIYRRGHWDLPKGKIDFGETEEQAAVREVQEETGVPMMSIIKRLKPTFHVYTIGHEWILKETHWFLMNASSYSNLKPQAEEGISEIKWIAADQLPAMSQKVFLSLKNVVSDAAANI